MISLQILESTAPPTVAEMVAADYRNANVFNQFGIDFCCGGKKSLAAVCLEKNIEPSSLEQALAQATTQSSTGVHWDFQHWETGFLVDFIVQAHHGYVRAQMPRLLRFGEKVARTHGDKWPETRVIYQLAVSLSDELMPHMEKEETVLFPYIKKLVAATNAGTEMPRAMFGTVQNPVRTMEMEHETAGRLMRETRKWSNDYTPPAGACNTFRVWYSLLREFEDDLHLHVHLENNLLFPRAIALEKGSTLN